MVGLSGSSNEITTSATPKGPETAFTDVTCGPIRSTPSSMMTRTADEGEPRVAPPVGDERFRITVSFPLIRGLIRIGTVNVLDRLAGVEGEGPRGGQVVDPRRRRAVGRREVHRRRRAALLAVNRDGRRPGGLVDGEVGHLELEGPRLVAQDRQDRRALGPEGDGAHWDCSDSGGPSRPRRAGRCR